jgi:siroheme synthase-like protein
MSSYPIVLHVAGKVCLVVGGGTVATRKVSALHAQAARIRVISPQISPALQKLHRAGEIQVHWGDYSPGLIEKLRPFLVFAATDSPTINQQVTQEAQALGILVNCVDAAAESNFSNMVHLQQGPITVGISTAGASPLLAQHLKKQLEAHMGREYTILAEWLAEARPQIQAQIADFAARRHFWLTLIESPILSLLRQNQPTAARQVFDQHLQNAADQRDQSG